MKALVLGGDGMLGHKIYSTLLNKYPDTQCTLRRSLNDPFFQKIDLFRSGNVHDQVDATNLVQLERLLQELRPEFVVNCVGIIKQRTEVAAAIPTITLNSLLPHVLSRIVSSWGGRLIHFSTDCVFSGRKGHYTEEDKSDAEDFYGQSKRLGEVSVDNALTLRTSIIGRELAHFHSLLEWFLSQNGKSVRGYTGAMYSGVTTNYLAKVVAQLIKEHSGLSGLYQITSATISKYELLRLLKAAYSLDVTIIPDPSESCDRSMLGDKFLQTTGYICPPWSSLVAELARDPTPYQSWR